MLGSYPLGAGPLGDDGGVGTDFSVSAPAVASTLVIGTPTVTFVSGFSVSAPAVASTLTIGVPSFSFTAGASLEPVTVAESKLAARIDDADLDLYIAAAISAAREHAEHITGRTYRRRVLRTELADWPAAGHSFSVHDPSGCEISYYSPTGWQVLDTAAFEFAGIDNGAQVAPALDTTWPELGRRALGARVRIDFTAGPASPDDVPEQVKLYIKAQVAAWADNPSGLIAGNLQPHPFLERLLDAEVLWC